MWFTCQEAWQSLAIAKVINTDLNEAAGRRALRAGGELWQ